MSILSCSDKWSPISVLKVLACTNLYSLCHQSMPKLVAFSSTYQGGQKIRLMARSNITIGQSRFLRVIQVDLLSMFSTMVCYYMAHLHNIAQVLLTNFFITQHTQIKIILNWSQHLLNCNKGTKHHLDYKSEH